MPDKDCKWCCGRGYWSNCLDEVFDCDCKTRDDYAREQVQDLAHYKRRLYRAEQDLDYCIRKIREIEGRP